MLTLNWDGMLGSASCRHQCGRPDMGRDPLRGGGWFSVFPYADHLPAGLPPAYPRQHLQSHKRADRDQPDKDLGISGSVVRKSNQPVKKTSMSGSRRPPKAAARVTSQGSRFGQLLRKI